MKHKNGSEVISVVPVEAFMDHRLTLIQLRVLGAILSFRNKDSGTAIVKRSKLTERCGYSEQKISSATTALERLGWVEKVGKGGHSRPCTYKINVPSAPETVPESGTVDELGTVPESGTPTVPESGTRKELSVLQSIEQNINPPLPPKGMVKGAVKFNPETLELPPFVARDLWLLFCQHRKEINHKLTETSCKLMIKNMERFHQSGYDVPEMIRTAIANGWRGIHEPKGKPAFVAPTVSRQARRVYQ